MMAHLPSRNTALGKPKPPARIVLSTPKPEPKQVKKSKPKSE